MNSMNKLSKPRYHMPEYKIACHHCVRHFLGGINFNGKRYDVYYCKMNMIDKNNIMFYHDDSHSVHINHIGALELGTGDYNNSRYKGIGILGEKLFLIYLGDKLNV